MSIFVPKVCSFREHQVNGWLMLTRAAGDGMVPPVLPGMEMLLLRVMLPLKSNSSSVVN